MKNNLSIKIIVAIIAIILWTQQIMLKTHKQEITVPIKIINLPNDYIITDSELPKIGIVVNANGSDIFKLYFSEHFFEIDATNFKYGENLFQLDIINFKYPSKINLDFKMFTTSKEVLITLEKIVERYKNIEIKYKSASAEEYFIKNKITNPSQKVKLRGPKKNIDAVEVIETKKISAKMVKNEQIEVELISPNPQIKLFKDKIILKISTKKQITKLMSLIPIQFPENQKLSIIPQKVSVMVKGPQKIIEKLKDSSIIANLNMQKIKEGFTSITFDVPSGVEIIEYTPQKIQVIQNQ